ncbi:hypothetical protein TCAL_14296 [Tigriopus californicus]|uniref:BTB domain-containing protein n=1 Tax=Tigriopus californicus TaxID=6832 RepID=A0A553NEQ8_TIGCA|nr:hypothetical protein TCAL_14296 [Tigriopus californicus]
MALVHKAKLTHYLSPTTKHVKEFFHSVTSLYSEGCHTDLNLVCGRPDSDHKGSSKSKSDGPLEKSETASTGASENSDPLNEEDRPASRDLELKGDSEEDVSGKTGLDSSSPAFRCFKTHQLMLASCSPFVRKLIQDSKNNDKCSCDNVTIMLPDYEAITIKNLLSIIYTGTSLGNCSVKELKSLIAALQIDITKLTTLTPSGNRDHGEFPDVEQNFTEADQGEDNGPNVPSPASDLFNHNLPDEDEPADDEMLEVTPEVQMFFGGHFLAENGDEETDKDSPGKHHGKENQHNGSSNLMEQSLQRFKEMARMNNTPQKAAVYENGTNTPTRSDSTDNSLLVRPSSTHSSILGGADMLSDGHDNRAYVCRLCGKASGNGASLFAHLLYPHYAHLWRTEIPHRAAKYDCKECTYTTTKRQHFVMHVARVHDDLRRKLAALGENLEVLENLTQKSHNSNDRIISNIAKGISPDDPYGQDESSMPATTIKEETIDGPAVYANPSKDQNTSMSAETAANLESLKTAALMSPYENINNRYPRGYKPFVKCRLCGKSWKGKDNFFTHLVSTHFKYMWANEVPKSADMYHCHVPGCSYQSKYRYNFLFHLAGKHKQLKHKLAQEGIPPDVLIPIETDGSELEGPDDTNGTGPSSLNSSSLLSSPADLLRQSKILMHQQKVMSATTTPATPSPTVKSGGGHPGGKPNANNTRLICRVCKKMSYNHTCHRQHVVGKHFQAFWAHLSADGLGVFNCHHPGCSYKTPNRSVFVIHLAYVHSELKDKLIASGKDPNCANPDVGSLNRNATALYFSHGSLSAF